MTRFTDQVAIITGGASGIGEATAKQLSNEGGTVALFDVQEDKLATVKAEIESSGGTVSTHIVDISNEENVSSAVSEVISQHSKIDILVNSGGIVGQTGTKIEDYDAETFDKVIAVNLRGPFLMAKYVIREMVKRDYGRVMLIASIAGKDGNPAMCGYTSSKAGCIGLVKGLGKEYATTNITINGLAPAVIRTPMNADCTDEQNAYMIAKIPMGRLGTIDEAASVITYAVSKECSFTTGFIFDLSGGRTVY